LRPNALLQRECFDIFMEELLKFVNWFQKNQFLTGMIVSGAIGGFALTVRRMATFIREKIRSRLIVSVMIESDDHAFDWITAWLNSRPGYARLRTIRVHTQRVAASQQAQDLPGFVREYVPQSGTYVLWYARRPVMLSLSREEEKDRAFRTRIRETYWITYPGRSRGVFEEILREGCSIVERKTDLIDIYIVASGGWHHLESRRGRSIESVLLPSDLRDSLLSDFNNFLNGRAWYESMGIPYRRGYLLYGPPGTGKSSIVAALAGHFKKNIYILNLAQTSDSSLRELLADVEENSIVLMEDVDSIFRTRPLAPATSASATPGASISLNGLLNLLDGVEAREGRIVFMSANNVNLLPEAMIRPGRIDRTIYVGYANAEQIRGMLSRFYGGKIRAELLDSFVEATEEAYVTMARLQEYLLARRDRPEAIVVEIEDLLMDRFTGAQKVLSSESDKSLA